MDPTMGGARPPMMMQMGASSPAAGAGMQFGMRQQMANFANAGMAQQMQMGQTPPNMQPPQIHSPDHSMQPQMQPGQPQMQPQMSAAQAGHSGMQEAAQGAAVPSALVQMAQGESSPSPTGAMASTAPAPGQSTQQPAPTGGIPQIKIGEKVQAQCGGWGSQYFPGTVRDLLPTGEVQVLWDGDEPSISNVPPSCVRKLPQEAPKEQAAPAQPVQPAQAAPAPSASSDASPAQPAQASPPEPQPAKEASTNGAASSKRAGPASRSFRYDLAPGDDLTGPFANLKRRVESELRDGCTISVALTICRPAAGQSATSPPVERQAGPVDPPAQSPQAPPSQAASQAPPQAPAQAQPQMQPSQQPMQNQLPQQNLLPQLQFPQQMPGNLTQPFMQQSFAAMGPMGMQVAGLSVGAGKPWMMQPSARG